MFVHSEWACFLVPIFNVGALCDAGTLVKCHSFNYCPELHMECLKCVVGECVNSEYNIRECLGTALYTDL
jgi:hypothetical protein